MAIDILDALKQDAVTYEDRKAKNRLTFPQAASMMDSLAIFSPKLIWAEQNGVSIGKVPDWAREGEN